MIVDHDPGDEQYVRPVRAMALSFCPFCKTITYYDAEVTERAAKDGSVRVICKFCLFKFWPGTREDIEQHKRA